MELGGLGYLTTVITVGATRSSSVVNRPCDSEASNCHRKSLKVIRTYIVEEGVFKFLLAFHCSYFYLVPFLRYSTSNNGRP